MPYLVAHACTAHPYDTHTYTQTMEQVGFKVWRPEAGYFVVAEVPAFIKAMAGTEDDKEIANWLTITIGVTAIPLSPFYITPVADKSRVFLRFAHCKDGPTLVLAAERLQKLL